MLPGEAVVFEYGSGGSTLWLQDRASRVHSVEHNQLWYDRMSCMTADNVTLQFVPGSHDGTLGSPVEPEIYFDEYVRTIDAQHDNSLDLLVVDGRARVACGLAGLSKIKPGGMLLLDDSDRERYRSLYSRLDGWPSFVATGLKLGASYIAQTTIWTKPEHA